MEPQAKGRRHSHKRWLQKDPMKGPSPAPKDSPEPDRRAEKHRHAKGDWPWAALQAPGGCCLEPAADRERDPAWARDRAAATGQGPDQAMEVEPEAGATAEEKNGVGEAEWAR